MMTREHLTSGPLGLVLRVIAFSVFALVLAEIVLRFILPACQVPPLYQDTTWRILRFSPTAAGETGLSTFGRFCRRAGEWRVNNAGWNSTFDYSSHKDPARLRVAILGDSYIEAMFSDVSQHVDADLYGLLDRRADVYSFGMGGWYLAQYIGAARYARDNFHPDVYFICLGASDVAASLRRSGAASSHWYQIEQRGGSFALVPPQSLYVTSWRHTASANSALIRYLLFNAQVRLPGQAAAIPADAPADDTQLAPPGGGAVVDPELQAAADYMVHQLLLDHPGSRIVFVTDGLRQRLYSSSSLPPVRIDPVVLIRNAVQRYPRAGFIDLMPWFLRDWQQHHARFEAVDGVHWNAHANSVVASALLDYLVKQGLAAPLQATAGK